ncbi:MAG: hypothetical protein JKX67_00535 [Colwellia sp.]|nr:hypothetical protein [Colwellia sp.]
MKFSKIKMIVLTVVTLSLAACGNTPTPKQIAKDDKAYSTDYGKYADNSKVAKINLDSDGKVSSIEIGNQNLKAPTRKVYNEGLGKTLVKEGFHTLRTLAGSNLVLGAVAIQGFKNVGARNYDSNNSHSEQNQQNTHTESNQANQQTNTETVSGIKAGSNVDQSQ